MSDEIDPYITAWTDQFGALLRDKVLQMLEAVKVTGWNSIAHVFDDPYDDDQYRLLYEKGEFWLTNLTTGDIFQIDLGRIGAQ